MNLLTMENFRCFRRRQNARLAPLTLLVGENSTGKTSVLALLRVLRDTVRGDVVPSFKSAPFDLGSFDEIANYRGGRGGRAGEFHAGFSANSPRPGSRSERRAFDFQFTFEKVGAAPSPNRHRIVTGDAWVEIRVGTDRNYSVHCGAGSQEWEIKVPNPVWFAYPNGAVIGLVILPAFLSAHLGVFKFLPAPGSSRICSAEKEQIRELFKPTFLGAMPYVFASAPVRSKPSRVYSPDPLTMDPGGDYIPMYLSDLSFQGERAWSALKYRIEGFGKAAGLFDEIDIRRLGKADSDPFQIQVRKFGGQIKGPWRNLIDVGYGISQVLPVITELLRDKPLQLFLLQQPEVHLHPSAQAALGSLFCEVAGRGQSQLVVETHSDHLIDRVRMDVRDRSTSLKPEDVSILYFERDGQEVNIHSIRIDDDGNIVGAPDDYRKFFLDEIERSFWGKRGG